MAKPMRRFHMKRSLFKKHQLWYVAGFLIINLAACIIIGNHAYRQIQADMNAHALQSQEEVQSVMEMITGIPFSCSQPCLKGRWKQSQSRQSSGSI